MLFDCSFVLTGILINSYLFDITRKNSFREFSEEYNPPNTLSMKFKISAISANLKLFMALFLLSPLAPTFLNNFYTLTVEVGKERYSL